jgi:hypothetical protein
MADNAGMEPDAPDLLRYWFEFDLTGHYPPPSPPGEIRLDGDTPTYRLLWRGVGVTGYDEHDCLRLVGEVLGEPLPPVLRTVRDPVIDERIAIEVGNPAWRGVWFPGRINLAGPVVG